MAKPNSLQNFIVVDHNDAIMHLKNAAVKMTSPQEKALRSVMAVKNQVSRVNFTNTDQLHNHLDSG